ncbi:MAG TPA: CpaF family protein [Acidimicrobiia bacterium]|nr:CpaF family protein [Acidimicrobiia bacterium]
MKLSDRMKQAQEIGGSPFGPAGAGSWFRAVADNTPQRSADALDDLKQRVQQAMFIRLGTRLYDSSVDPEELSGMVVQEIDDILANEDIPLSEEERARIVTEISEDVLGYGPLEKFLADPTITEIMVNTADTIYVERDGKLQLTEARFFSDDHLRRGIERIVSQVGRRIDESSPMVDARLADGSRVNAVIPPLAVDGPMLTVRKFSRRALQAADLVKTGTLSDDTVEFLDACVRGRLNVLVSGGTGAGKTTLLNVLSSFIGDGERIVTIEDAVELRMSQRHVVRMESRPPNIEGKGQVTIRDLVRNALRMRPDRIIVGEVRSGEALDMLQAMNTGHDGSLSTLHANSPRDALSRLETMVLMAGMDLPVRAIREQIASAIDLIVHMSRLRDGSRRVTHISEVGYMEGEVISLSDIYLFDYSAGMDDKGRFVGSLKPTGLRPGFSDKLEQNGIHLEAQIFGVEDALAMWREFGEQQ